MGKDWKFFITTDKTGAGFAGTGNPDCMRMGQKHAFKLVDMVGHTLVMGRGDASAAQAEFGGTPMLWNVGLREWMQA